MTRKRANVKRELVVNQTSKNGGKICVNARIQINRNSEVAQRRNQVLKQRKK